MRSNIRLMVMAAVGTMGPLPGSAVELGAGQVRIELRPQFIARSAEVRLGDIATLHTTDYPTIQRLAALPLGRAPLVGAEVLVRRDVVARWVHRQLGIGPDHVLWSGADETRVRTLVQEFPAARIEQTAKVALSDWLARRASRHGIGAIALPADLKLPSGQVGLHARPLPANAEPAPRMVVWVDVQVDGRFVRTVPVSFAVEAYREAWVAPTAIAGGTALMPGMVEKREVEITTWAPARLPARGLPPSKAAGSWRTTKALKEGEPLTAANSGPAPAIARGDWVALHLKSAMVELEGRARALQDGEMGQTVKVRSANGATPIEARVVAPGRVEVML